MNQPHSHPTEDRAIAQVSFHQVSFQQGETAIRTIRQRVFQQEQGVDPALEWDGRDEEAQHLLAYCQGQAVGTLRMRRLQAGIAKIERLAVLPAARGKGIGTDLMQTALGILAAQGMTEAIIHAQMYVKALYERLGFEIVGEPFVEAGIPHVKMRRSLVDS